MGACCSSQPVVDRAPMIVDVEHIVAEAAWDMFYYSRSRTERWCMRRKDYRVEVPMNYFHFQVTDQKLFNVQDDDCPGKKQGKQQDSNENNRRIQSDLRNRELARQTQTAPQHVGLETEFKNSTGEKQTYNFKCEKSRKASMTVNFQKGFSIGGKANFSLGLPKILADGNASGEVDMRVSVTKTTGETFEQTLTTCATSDITVAPHSHYTATVVMEERHLLADFKVWVMMSMPAKEARAVIKNKRGENVFFYKLRNLPELFPEKNHLKDEDGEDRSDAVEFVVEGRVDGMQISSHRINLFDHGLKENETDSQIKDSKAG